MDNNENRLALLNKQFVGPSRVLVQPMLDRQVTDILINGVHSMYLEEAGVLTQKASPFSSSDALFDFIERLVVPIGKRIDAARPYLDGRLVEGSRFHIILPPIAVSGPYISIRKFRQLDDCRLESFGPPDLVEWLGDQVRCRHNILIAGGTGSGKTTLLCRLLEKVPTTERVAIIEETLEIRPVHLHVVNLEARPASPEGSGEVTLQCLVRNALRMRPDRIVVGECRGKEAFDMLQAMNTGHNGSLCTIHANGAHNSKTVI